MSLADTRRRRLRLLIQEVGSQRELSDLCDFKSDNYISQLLSPSKPFGEKAARKIERGAKKPEKWLDEDGPEAPAAPPPWPFSFDRMLWDRLPPARKRRLEEQFETAILGASVQEAAAPTKKRTG